MPPRLQFSLRTSLIAIFALALVAWPTMSWLRIYLANRGLVPVKGRVTFKGQPVLAKVLFSPAVGGTPVQGVTNAVGDYDLESLVRPGQYAVGITQGTGSWRLPPKYGDSSTSGLTVIVPESGDSHFAFDLRD